MKTELSAAPQVYEQMKSHGPAPDAMTYDKLITGCVRAGQVTESARA